jgi:ribosomal protein L1
MSGRGKRYDASLAKIDREKLYAPVEAIQILKSLEEAKFDETVEVHFVLGLNVRHADEQLRGTIMLPNGTGKSVRVAVFAEGDKAREAEEAGADIVGSADLAAKVEAGFTEFDVAIATSKSVNPPSTFAARSAEPTISAPASSASRALSPSANTATRTDLPVPFGSMIVPRSCSSA